MHNILIVDDVMVNRKLIKTILGRLQMELQIFEASCGLDAIAYLNERRFSIIILDIMMPEINGMDVLKIIKSDPFHWNTSVIICSAVQELSSIEEALTHGAQDYFVKPLTSEQIRITLPLKIRNAIELYSKNMEVLQYHEQMSEELRMAKEIQEMLIDKHLQFEHLEMFGRYVPCNDIGGDMYVCKANGNSVAFLMADISGHGVAAAMISTLINVIFNSHTGDELLPNRILERINSYLCEAFGTLKTPLVTAVVGTFDGKELLYANAGHPYPLLIKSGSELIEELTESSYMLGLFEKPIYTNHRVYLEHGDTLLMYTDGLFDVGLLGEYTTQGVDVKKYLQEYAKKSPLDMNRVLDEMLVFYETQSQNGFDDDVAILSLRVK